jgi:hypothetical protein
MIAFRIFQQSNDVWTADGAAPARRPLRRPLQYIGAASYKLYNMADSPKKRALQAHGLHSKVYGPILLHIFKQRWRQGTPTVLFTLDDVRNAADALNLEVRNPADLIYRMRSRTVLPKEILDKGFYILRAIGRGQYQFEKGSSTIFEPLDSVPTEAIDITPLPVRRLLPETMAEMDEQAVLTVASYCKLFDHFTGLQVYRLRSHVRKSVPGVGQAELDAIDVGVALRDDEMPIVFPIEAKAAADALNRVQIFNMIQYSKHYFPEMTVRPLAIKVDYDSILHLMEFSSVARAADLKIVRSASYVLSLSEQQTSLIRATRKPAL